MTARYFQFNPAKTDAITPGVEGSLVFLFSTVKHGNHHFTLGGMAPMISKLAKISWISTQKNGAAKHTKKEKEIKIEM